MGCDSFSPLILAIEVCEVSGFEHQMSKMLDLGMLDFPPVRSLAERKAFQYSLVLGAVSKCIRDRKCSVYDPDVVDSNHGQAEIWGCIVCLRHNSLKHT